MTLLTLPTMLSFGLAIAASAAKAAPAVTVAVTALNERPFASARRAQRDQPLPVCEGPVTGQVTRHYGRRGGVAGAGVVSSACRRVSAMTAGSVSGNCFTTVSNDARAFAVCPSRLWDRPRLKYA